MYYVLVMYAIIHFNQYPQVFHEDTLICIKVMGYQKLILKLEKFLFI